MTANLTLMLLAWGIDVLIGWPEWLYRCIRHPVVWIGALIGRLETLFNAHKRSSIARYCLGAGTSVLVITVSAAAALGLVVALPTGGIGLGVQAVLASSLLATRSLYKHVRAVGAPLSSGDSMGARRAVSMIVGRDTALLDDSGIAKAAIESLAENTSDGVTAPLFWGILLGLPGIAVYKAINTLDSMIGHKSARYRAFGCFAARLDDLVNYVPARLTGLLFAVVRCSAAAARAMLRDARKHPSPNAGWPEAAMAGALGLQLGGPRAYRGGSKPSAQAVLNEPGDIPAPGDIARALTLYVHALGLLAASLIGWTVLWRL